MSASPSRAGRPAVVIGGGPAGLKAAHELVKAGARVTLLESGPVLGGLASSFDVQGTRIERYYHFICKGDDDLLETLAELGLSARLHWKSSRMAYFVDGQVYPFLTPLELLRFRPLSFVDRLRAGLAVKLAQRLREEDLAPQQAIPWLKRMFGEAAYGVIWEPLMRFKFAEHAPRISAAWIWARMVRLSRSRTNPWREELGYLEGGSQTVLEGLGRDFERRGGRILLNAPVEQILFSEGRIAGVRVGGETLPAEALVSTITTSRFRQLAVGFEGPFVEALKRIPTIGIFCLVLRLSRPVTPFFWVNATDPTNLIWQSGREPSDDKDNDGLTNIQEFRGWSVTVNGYPGWYTYDSTKVVDENDPTFFGYGPDLLLGCLQRIAQLFQRFTRLSNRRVQPFQHLHAAFGNVA